MATREIKCDDCEKEKCPDRLVGSICSRNSEIAPLIESAKSRDPVMLSRFIVSIIASEHERYGKAKDMEDIGKEEYQDVITKTGEIITVKKKRGIDNNVTNLASNIIKAAKTVNDVLNPPKSVPFMQTNNQYNIKIGMVDEIRSLPEEDKVDALRFIDDKLDATRKN